MWHKSTEPHHHNNLEYTGGEHYARNAFDYLRINGKIKTNGLNERNWFIQEKVKSTLFI